MTVEVSHEIQQLVLEIRSRPEQRMFHSASSRVRCARQLLSMPSDAAFQFCSSAYGFFGEQIQQSTTETAGYNNGE
jgi:hypothetical protein